MLEEFELKIKRLDHLVLTVKDLDATVAFYRNVLGMEVVHFEQGRVALKFGDQRINLHQAGSEIEPKVKNPQPGSVELCFLTNTPLTRMAVHLSDLGVEIEEGPVERTGAKGTILSLYIRDPDGNLIELSDVF